MKVLHIVKTSDGAIWAARMAAVLTALGVEVHVALPRKDGRAVPVWLGTGAILHECDLDLPLTAPQRLPKVLASAKDLVREVSPDLIHSHFVGTTLTIRLALGNARAIPRVFQVPGPLHLEHEIYRRAEIMLAGEADYWIGSSRCVVDHYRKSGIPEERVFLSYYGDLMEKEPTFSKGTLRTLVGASKESILVGSISWMYPPKYYLGQRIGLKAHEDLIDAIAKLSRMDQRVLGVIAGAPWGGANWYLEKLKRRARDAAGNRIVFTGSFATDMARQAWRDFDLVLHLPISENCGGVVEPLLAGVPVIASRVGGLPEVIVEKVTGRLVPPRDPDTAANIAQECLIDHAGSRETATRGRSLVQVMFDVERTGREVLEIYKHILSDTPRPSEFDSETAVLSSCGNQPLTQPAHGSPKKSRFQSRMEESLT